MKIELVKNHKLLDKNEAYLIAVSTGIDSMCLFDYLYKEGFKLGVLHVNHKRRKESQDEYLYLKNYLKKLNVPFFYYELNETINSNFQEEARKLRYNFFIKTAKENGYNSIITAHQADDLVETIIYRLIRGTMDDGYLGIKEKTIVDDINIIRPMLNTPRSLIETYQKENNIKYFEDSSNSENHYTRNKIRHNVLPTLKDINSNLYSSINNFRSDISDLLNLSKKASDNFVKEKAILSHDRITFKVKDFDSLDRAIKKEVIKYGVNYVSKNSLELTHERLNEVLLTNLNDSKDIELGKNIVLSSSVGTISIYRLKENDFKEIIFNEYKDYEDETVKVSFSQKNQSINDKYTYLLCYNKIEDEFPLKVRKLSNGDKIRLGNVNKKISDILMEGKIEKDLRKNVLVFLNKNDEIFFVPGHARKTIDNSKEQKLYIKVVLKNEN